MWRWSPAMYSGRRPACACPTQPRCPCWTRPCAASRSRSPPKFSGGAGTDDPSSSASTFLLCAHSCGWMFLGVTLCTWHSSETQGPCSASAPCRLPCCVSIMLQSHPHPCLCCTTVALQLLRLFLTCSAPYLGPRVWQGLRLASWFAGTDSASAASHAWLMLCLAHQRRRTSSCPRCHNGAWSMLMLLGASAALIADIS